ncbi:hypothetical protein JZ751_008666 [Albula glossodonta]|uniref:Uncharacterized protein n=1 Tax=Albula glossodonta TaxID=121402 RepID=A0A8T2P7D0_9TELE|nr:hypothetical protein JZ751_008666 [Albula glossodonta]
MDKAEGSYSTPSPPPTPQPPPRFFPPPSNHQWNWRVLPPNPPPPPPNPQITHPASPLPGKK